MGAVLIGVFVASAVEVTEMVIIVVGVGATRGWRSTLIGAGAGLAVLAGIVIGLGRALSLIPIGDVRVIIGALLLTFGLQWLRKGIIGVAEQGFWGGAEEEADTPAGAGGDGAIDWTAFVLSFKGVLLEGLEIAFIVVAFGAGNGGGGSYVQAAIGAAAAFVLVGGLGLLVRRRLESVPGRTLKFGVGGLLTTFGTFWTMEGLNVHWPAQKLSLAWLYAAYLGAAFLFLSAVRAGLLGPPPSMAQVAGSTVSGNDNGTTVPGDGKVSPCSASAEQGDKPDGRNGSVEPAGAGAESGSGRGEVG